MPRINFSYQVDDGYAGGERPQSIHVDSEEFDDDMDREAIAKYLTDVIQEDFEQRISWFCPRMDEVVEEIQRVLQGGADA